MLFSLAALCTTQLLNVSFSAAYVVPMFNVWPNSPKERRRRAKVFKFAAFSFYSSSPWQCLKSNKMHKDSNFSIWIINWASKGPIATNLFKRKCKSLESAEGKLNNFSMARGAPFHLERQISES